MAREGRHAFRNIIQQRGKGTLCLAVCQLYAVMLVHMQHQGRNFFLQRRIDACRPELESKSRTRLCSSWAQGLQCVLPAEVFVLIFLPGEVTQAAYSSPVHCGGSESGQEESVWDE